MLFARPRASIYAIRQEMVGPRPAERTAIVLQSNGN